jgi:type I restriction-modification system DNA methylase subunit
LTAASNEAARAAIHRATIGMSSERSASKSSIEKLVRFFEQNIYQLKSPGFNETQARQQLIDPFFEALGWDVHNRKMNPIYLQEVIPEGRVKTSVGKEVKEQQVLFDKKETLGKAQREYASILDYIAEDNYKASWKEAIKKPDYRFRIKGQTKFFVEAKKPFVDLSKSAEAIFQVKRYGFSGRVPVSILTDFEEFRTFDCTYKPEFDKPKLGIVKEFDLTYKQYLDEFERLYDTFSHDAVAGGSLDTLTRKLLLKKTGDFALDKHFLEDLSKWREELARDIAKHPKNRRRLTDYTLNESVQRILDRIVFFRVCEDREIEVENTLLAILRLWQGRPGVSLYSLLNDLFKQRRPLYNGLLFAPHECEELEVGDDVLLKILEGLNYPFSPYYFNEIGVEILGSIYEKFLGKTIHLTPKTVRVEEKPEVRKAGGVYYTPQYIVNYIVDNTVGKLLYEDADGNAGKRKLKLSPKQVAKLTIIDIACGSGSFLLGAFQKLIDYHTEWYHEHPKDVESVHNVPDAYSDVNGTLRLSSRKKRDILLNNIYGVDIDRQAVEVTQMSLYLKVLEGENADTLNPQMMLALKEAYLPSLGNNIKCGNSLVGTDMGGQEELFDQKMTQRINPFDWEMGFPDIKSAGGFDVIIGNPPYGARFSEPEKEYLFAKYPLIVGQPESYEYFILLAINLLRNGGYLSFINPNNFIESDRSEGLRKTLLKAGTIRKICNFRYRIWKENASETLVFVFEKGVIWKESLVTHPESEEDFLHEKNAIVCNQKDWEDSPKTRFLVRANIDLIRKIEDRSVQLGELCNAGQGIIVYKTRIESTKNLYISNKCRGRDWKKLLDTASTIQRYNLDWGGRYLKYGKWLWRPRENVFFESPKILVVRLRNKSLVRRIVATYDDQKYYNRDNFNNVILRSQKYDLKYVLGVLNSLLVNYWYKSYFDNVNINPEQISLIPLRSIDFSKPVEISVHKRMVGLVERMLELNSLLQKATFDSEKEPIQRQIAAADKKIDSLVYELYGLTEAEIKIVEGKQ